MRFIKPLGVWLFRVLVCFLRAPTLYFLSAKYSRTIMRINPLTDVPFFAASVLSCSITSGEKKTFVLSLLAIGLGDNLITSFYR